jgi:hypothetical protein
MKTMRERIANAIVDELGVSRGLLDGVDYVVMVEIREAVADAVLAELQKPTVDMVQAMIGDGIESRGYLKFVFIERYAAAIIAAREGK